MEYVCPKCKRSKMLPAPTEGDLWMCQHCNYKGKPVIISDSLKEFWNEWLKSNVPESNRYSSSKRK